MEHLIRINKKQKKALLIVTHDPLIASYCNNLIFIKDGIIIDKMKKMLIKKNRIKKFLIRCFFYNKIKVIKLVILYLENFEFTLLM